LIIVGSFLYTHYHKNKLHNPPASNNSSGRVNDTPSPKASQAQPSSNNSAVSGGVTDNNGQSNTSLPPSSDWASSASGLITLQQPSASSSISSGDTISGQAQVSTVQFILIDNSVGLIAQGSLNVVDGKFAGILHFTAHASSGKLEVFTSNPSTGAEEDVIDINVNFN